MGTSGLLHGVLSHAWIEQTFYVSPATEDLVIELPPTSQSINYLCEPSPDHDSSKIIISQTSTLILSRKERDHLRDLSSAPWAREHE